MQIPESYVVVYKSTEHDKAFYINCMNSEKGIKLIIITAREFEDN